MKREVIVSSVILLFLLPVIFAASSPTSASDELKKGINEAVYHAVQYHIGNEKLADNIANINEVEDRINSALISTDSADINQASLKETLGNPNSETSWVSKTSDQEVKVDTPVPVWQNKVIFDGNQQLTVTATPTINENGKVNYNLKFTSDFAQSKPVIDLKNEINGIGNTAKEYALNPKDIQKANQLAETSVNIENLFKDYAKLSQQDSCDQMMANILGAETKTSQVEVITKEYQLSNKDSTILTAKLEICEKCNNVDYFVNLKTDIEKDGKILEYPSQATSVDQFKNLDTTGIKRAIIDTNQVLQQVTASGNYESAYGLMKRLEGLNSLWSEKTSTGDSKTKLESFTDQNQFFQTLLQDYPVKTSTIEQTSYEKTLVQEFTNNGEEICTNHIDDNGNGLIDCADNICSGKVCGTSMVNVTNGNITTQELKEMYCTLGQCQLKEESKIEAPVCGNNKCEEGENVTCSQDCKVCPTYPAVECNGELISKGQDANGCPLEPICIQNTNSCATSSDCVQPLCGKSECINGQCQAVEINLCQAKVCDDGEKKSEACDSGESIIVERCANGAWQSTGLKCITAVSGPVQVINGLGTECNVSTDCLAEKAQCVLGRCQPLAIKKELVTAPSIDKSGGISATTFTGQTIKLTTEVLTGVVPDPTTPDVLGKPKDYTRPLPEGTGTSFLTGVSRTDTQQGQVAVATTQTSPQTQQTLIKTTNNEKNVFGVTGVCIKSKDGTTPILKFDGDGDQFKAITQLQNSYKQDGTEAYCQWKLENLLRERKEIEKSFNEEFVKKYFEQDLVNYINDWENAYNIILKIHNKNVENQIETAKMMECLGIKELNNYDLININYANPLYGTLKYEEKTSSAKFTGMTNAVTIISPSIAEFSIFPSREFIKSELENDMANGNFPGTSKSSAERSVNKGLTQNELESLKQDQKVLDLIDKITANSPDGNLDVQLKIMDGEEIVYNMYIRINKGEIAKAQPLEPEKTPNKNYEITLGFQEVYDILQNARKRTYAQNAPWEQVTPTPSSIVNSIKDWLDTQIRIRNLMNSVTVTPSGQETDIKDLLKEVFFVIGGSENTSPAIATSAQVQTVYDSQGKATTILN